MQFEIKRLAVIIKPKDQPIFSEYATTVKITDEAAGEFVEVNQDNCGNGLGKIAITHSEWPLLRQAIDELLAECSDVDL